VTAPPRVGDIGLLGLRLALAAVFGVHGYLKILGGHFDRTVALFMTVNIPAPEIMAWVVGIMEFGGSILLVTGLWTRPMTALLAVEMAVALARVRWAQGFLGAAEFEVVLLAACLALTTAGAGKFSLDASLRGGSVRRHRARS